MQQHSKEAAELYMISPLSNQMENMQNNTEGEYFWYLYVLDLAELMWESLIKLSAQSVAKSSRYLHGTS